MTTRLQYLRDESVGMIADLEKSLVGMTADELEIVTARLANLRLEIGERRLDNLIAEIGKRPG